jgi:hypothetical protein
LRLIFDDRHGVSGIACGHVRLTHKQYIGF